MLPRAALQPAAVASRALPPSVLHAMREGRFHADGAIDGAAFGSAVRTGFRASLPAAEVRVATDDVFTLLRMLPIQQLLSANTTTTVTRGVEVEVTTHRLLAPEQEDAGGGTASLATGQEEHIFMYRVRLRHAAATGVAGEAAPQACQLQGRHLIFRDASGAVHTAVGPGAPGVVGEYPVLQPAEPGEEPTVFEYCSGCKMPTAKGSMEGSFQMVELVPPAGERDGPLAAGEDWEEGERFDAFFKAPMLAALS